MHLYSGLASSSGSNLSDWSSAMVRRNPSGIEDATATTKHLVTRAARSTKSLLVSPASLAFMQATKHSLLMKRKYVDGHGADIVDLVICIASIVGALSIIIPYCINRRSRKMRHALILGLATSDLVSSLIITATTSFLIAGGDLNQASKFCTFAGYMFSSSLWTQHFWNVSIAGITYVLLVFPLSSFISNVERHLIWLWPLFWTIALIANGIAWHYVGFTFVDGYCTYNSRRGGAYFSAVFQFVPRAMVVLIILVLYTHLFFFLRRINLFSAAATSRSSRRQGSRGQQGSSNSSNADNAGNGSPTQSHGDRGETQAAATQDHQHHSRTGSLGRAASAMLTKIRRTYSSSTGGMAPSTLIGDTSSKRNGSASTQGKSSSTCPPISLHEPIQMVDYSGAEVSPKTMPSDADDVLQRQQAQRTYGGNGSTDTGRSVTLDLAEVISSSAPSHALPSVPPPAMLRRPSTASVSISPHLTAPRRPTTAPPLQSDAEGINGITEEAGKSNMDELYKPMSIRRDVRDFGMTSPPQEHLRHFSLSPTGVKLAKRAMAETGGVEAHEQAAAQATGEKDKAVVYEDLLGPGWTWGMPVEQNGVSNDPTSKKRSGSPTNTSTGRRRSSRWNFWSPSSRRDGQGTGSVGSSTEERGVESLGSTLNRQASVLLLLYPAVYVCLFSVSIIRIIVDLSTPLGSRDPRRNSDALHAISRWTIFAQGAIDALIFQIIERAFRRRLKRRRRIAAGEKVEDTLLTQLAKWLKALVKPRSSTYKADGSATELV